MIRYGLLLLFGYAAIAVDALAPTWQWPVFAPRATTLLLACIASRTKPATAIPCAILLGLASVGTSPIVPGWNLLLFVASAFVISETAPRFFRAPTWRALYATLVTSCLLAAGAFTTLLVNDSVTNDAATSLPQLARLLAGQIGATVGCGAFLALLLEAVTALPSLWRPRDSMTWTST